MQPSHILTVLSYCFIKVFIFIPEVIFLEIIMISHTILKLNERMRTHIIFINYIMLSALTKVNQFQVEGKKLFCTNWGGGGVIIFNIK